MPDACRTTDKPSCKMIFVLAVIFVIFPKTLSTNYIPASGSQYPHVALSPSVSHGRGSGIMQEKECFVARMCEYKILEKFSCKVSEYVVSNGVERTLPKWLWFDKNNKTLKGIPSPADEGLSEILITGLNRHQTGPTNYICGLLTVKITVWDLKYFPLFTQNVPTSPVIDDKLSKPSLQAGLTCQFNEPIILASLVFAGNFYKMYGKEKINVLDELLQRYHISIYDVFMLPNNEDLLPGLLQTSHVLASGPGADRFASGQSATITWHVRCGVINLDDALFPALEKLSSQLTFINDVGYAPIGWHVVTAFQKHHARRRRNVVGTTTPAYSTAPISRATVITTKIKITKTTFVTATRTFTWTRPLPTFSSPHAASNTSLYNLSSTVSSVFNNTITASQYNDVSSTSLAMSLLNTLSSLSSRIVSPSKYERSNISQYKSVSSTPVMYSSGSISSLSRSSTLEMPQLKNISSTNMFSKSPSGQTLKTSTYVNIFSTLPVISRSKNKSAILQVSSSSPQQISSNSLKTSSQMHSTSRGTGMDSLTFTTPLPSSKLSTFVQSSLTASTNQRSSYVIVPSTVQTASLFTSGHYSTSKASIIWSTTTMSKATQPNNSATSLQSSYSDFMDSVMASTLGTYSPVSHLTTSRIINETKYNSNQTSHERSTAHTSSMLSILTTASTNNVATPQKSLTVDPSYVPRTTWSTSPLHRSRTTPSSLLSCTNSCSVSTSSKNLNFTLTTSVEQRFTTTLHQASAITSGSRDIGTLVLNGTSVTPQTSEYVDKTPESLVLTSGTISKSRQSSDYITYKTLTATSIIYPSRLSSRSGKTIQSSQTGPMTSQRTFDGSIGSTFTFTGKTLHVTTSQSSAEHESSFSPVLSTVEKLTTKYSSLIKTTPTWTYTKTVGSGTLITNTVPNRSVSPPLFSSDISGAVSSYTTPSGVADSSVAGTIDQSTFQVQSSIPLSPHIVSFSSLANSLVSSSNTDLRMSTLTVPSFYRTPTLTAFATVTPSLVVSSYQHVSSSVTSKLFVIASTPSSHQMSSSRATIPVSTFAIVTASSYFLSSHTPATLTSNFHTSAPSFFTADTTFFPSLSSYNTTIPPSFVVTTATIPPSLVISSYHTHISPLSFSSVTLSSSYRSSALPSVVTTTDVLFRKTGTTQSLVIDTLASSDEQPSFHTTGTSTVSTITSSSYLLTSYKVSSTLSVVTTYISYRIPTLLSSAVTSTSFAVSLGNTGTSPTSIIASSFSSNGVSFHHTSSSSPFVFMTSSRVLSHHKHTSLSTSVNTITSSYYLSSYHIAPSSATVIHLSDLLSSYHTQDSSFVVAITPSLSYHTPTSLLLPGNINSTLHHTVTPLSIVPNITSSTYLPSSYNAVLSSFSSTTDALGTSPRNLPSSSTSPTTPHKTFSLSFLSSSIVSSKPSISSDFSGPSMPYTLTKLSSRTPWLPSPSYTWQSPHTTTVVLTLTSATIPVIASRSGVTPSSTSSQSSSTVVTRPTIPSRESPKVYNSFDLLRVTLGKVFSVQIPVDTFHDREDGNTRHLRLECLTVGHARLPGDSWLQFNSTTQTLYGLVLKSQVGTIPSEYLLSASDHDGNTVYDAFTVVIEESSKVLAATFSLELTKINLETFNRDINNVLSIVATIAGYYGDTDESMIQVLSLEEGSVIFTWSNTSLQTCDKYLINDTASKIMTRKGNVQPHFYNALSPRYTANNVFLNYTGSCVVPSTDNPTVSGLSSHETSAWLEYVLPSLAVAVLIIVIVVAVLLVKRRSGVKILKEDKQTFKRRKPIILDDEQEMSTLCGKPIELPEDSLSPIRFPRETSFQTPEYDEDDIPELPSPIVPAPSYQRLPPRYSGEYNRHTTPPPPYRLPPSY